MPRVPNARPIIPPVASLPKNGHSTNGHALPAETIDQPTLLAALRGMRAGDFGVRLPLDWTGVPGAISDVFNEVVELNQRLGREFAELTQSSANLRAQLTDVTHMATDRDRVLNAVARGDLSQRVALDIEGRQLEGAFLRSGHVVKGHVLLYPGAAPGSGVDQVVRGSGGRRQQAVNSIHEQADVQRLRHVAGSP